MNLIRTNLRPWELSKPNMKNFWFVFYIEDILRIGQKLQLPIILIKIGVAPQFEEFC